MVHYKIVGSGFHSISVLLLNVFIFIIFDIKLNNSLLFAAFLHQINIIIVSQMNLNISFLNMNVHI